MNPLRQFCTTKINLYILPFCQFLKWPPVDPLHLGKKQATSVFLDSIGDG